MQRPTVQGLGHWRERHRGGGEADTGAPQHLMAKRAEVLRHLTDQPGLAHTGLAMDRDGSRLTLPVLAVCRQTEHLSSGIKDYDVCG